MNQTYRNLFYPAYIDTEMADYGVEQRGASKEDLGKMHLIGYMGEPMDVAYGVVYLASDESKFVTGAELVIDGGLTAQWDWVNLAASNDRQSKIQSKIDNELH